MGKGKARGGHSHIMAGERHVVGIEDLVLMSKLSNEEVARNLKIRFDKDEIYTYIGPVLIACNPFRWLRLYDAPHVKMHENANRSDLAPHIYAVAEASFRNMISEEDKQCVIISGESGAGKTEAAKQIMSYIAAVSGSGGNDRAVTEVKNIILDSNPLLEAFGNAMTLRNNNSSRFGKYFELRFDLGNGGTPRGGRITNYLLEKSRVVHPGPGERSFHIFYQLIAGAPRDLKDSLGLSSPDHFNVLRISGVSRIDNEGGRTDDAKEFQDTLHSFETVGMRDKEQFAVFQVLAVVLHLSNIDFRAANVQGAEGSSVVDRRTVEYAASIMGVDAGALEYALTFRTLTTMAPGGAVETYQVPQNPHQARAARDALAKDLYFRLFDMIVKRVNEALESCGQSTRMSMRKAARQINDDNQLSIGVLDIYGFEIFETNAFEQFCINFVNEKLQQIFIELTLRAEQEEYASEGIQWTPIPFFDNKVVCELIEAKRPPGVFAILDDTCKTIHANQGNVDQQFLQKLKSQQGSHQHLSAFAQGFTILHYAGEVQYTVSGFVEANKDTLFQDLQLLCQSSTVELVRGLYPEEVNIDQRRQPTTAGYKIKNQCGDLVYTLMDCNPHYVRCIKSNDRKKAGMFDEQRVLHQCRYLGLLENVKVRRAGFAYRVDFFRFIARFKVLGAGQIDARVLAHGSDYDIAAAILNAAVHVVPALTTPGETQLGRSKVFIKSPETYFALQDQRKAMVNQEVVKIQTAWRRFMNRRDLVNLRIEMSDLFNQSGKEITPADLLRPYHATYITKQDMKLAISALLEKYQLSEIKMERMQFADQVYKMGKDKKWEKLIMIVTDKALYFAGYQPATRAVPTGKKGGKKGTNQPARLLLRRRTLLKNIEGVKLSLEADDLILLQMKPQEKLKKPIKDNWEDKSKVKRCMETQEPFSFFGKKKHRCHYTGGVYIQDVTKVKVPLPDRGFYSPVEVHDSVVGTVSTEMREDVVLMSDKKAEIAAVIRDLVTRARGGGARQDAPILAQTKIAKPKQQVKAMYDYDAQQSDELSIRAGEIIELADSSNPDWWIGRKAGKEGCFPASYVQRVAAQQVHRPTRANPRRYLCDVTFANEWVVRQATVSSLSNTPKATIKFVRDPSVQAVKVKTGGTVIVAVPPGVAGQKLRQIQANQEARLARKEAERQELYELRRQNAAKREAERQADRERRLAAKREKKAAERQKRNKEREVMNFGAANAQAGGASFAARLAGQRNGSSAAAGNGSSGATVPPWVAARGGGGSSGYVPRPQVQMNKPKPVKPKAPPVKKSPWEAFTDDDSGDTYYYNNETGESQWEMPVGFNGSSQAAPAGSGQMSYSQLLAAKQNGAQGMDASRLELYLADGAYQEAFGMDKATFDAMPNWKKDATKRKAKLY